MDREKIIRHLNQHYLSKRGMVARVPLGVQPDALWEELLNRRRSVCSVLPLHDGKGAAYWYVTTDKMIRASEKIVGELYDNEADFDPYTEAPPVSTLEEVFYTSYVDGAQVSMKEAMDFLAGGNPPGDIEEQMIANNRIAGNFATANLGSRISPGFLQELTAILTDGMDGGGGEYRAGEVMDFVSPDGEEFHFPPPDEVPGRVEELCTFLATPRIHPLIKAAAAQAFILAVRPFPEGNGRLGRMVSSMVLIRAGYTFFGEVSLSALAARKSYGYYESMANVLREESGSDLTYFLEYYICLLARAVDERRLRIQQRDAKARKAELEMAREALGPAQGDGGGTIRNRGPGNGQTKCQDAGHMAEPARERQEENPEPEAEPDADSIPASREKKENKPTGPPPEETTPAPHPVGSSGVLMQKLYAYARETDKVCGQLAQLLLQKIDGGNAAGEIFSCGELAEEMQISPMSLATGIKYLKKDGILLALGRKGGRAYYTVAPTLFTDSESDSPSKPEQDNSIATSGEDKSTYEALLQLGQSHSPKDKRIAAALLEHMDSGEITEEDYEAHNVPTRWKGDMHLASQLGLVEMITPQRYAIRKQVKDAPPALDSGQRRIIGKMYDAFGADPFSVDMVVATLDYSGSYASARLHQLTLLKLVDCQREDDTNRYQLLVSPEETPEYFDIAS